MTNAVNGEYVYTFASPMPNNRYSISTAAFGGGSVPDATVTYKDQLPTGFTAVVCNGDGTKVNSAHSFTVHASNSVPPKGTTGADAWSNTGGDGSLNGSYNLNVQLQGDGTFNYTFINPMPSANYGVQVSVNSPATDRVNNVINKTTTGFTVQTFRVGTEEAVAHAVLVTATNAQLPSTVTQDQIDRAVSGSAAAWGVIDGATGNKYGAGLNFTSTRTSQGNYTVTFDTPMPNDAYAISLACQSGNGRVATVGTKTRTSFQIRAKDLSDADQDFTTNFTVFATNAPAPKGGTGADAFAYTGSGTICWQAITSQKFNVLRGHLQLHV